MIVTNLGFWSFKRFRHGQAIQLWRKSDKISVLYVLHALSNLDQTSTMFGEGSIFVCLLSYDVG